MDRFPSRERSAAAALGVRVSAVVVASQVDARANQQSLNLCLRSSLLEPWIDELVIVDHDNAAPASSMLRGFKADRRMVKLVVAPREASLAAAANLGARRALGRWLLFLDHNVVLKRGSIAPMAVAGGAAPQPWIVGGLVTDVAGRERQGARMGELNAFSALAVALDSRGDKPRYARRRTPPAKVAAVSSAFMLMPRRDFEALHGFDENFVSAAADLDLCRRAADAGGSVLFQPTALGTQVSPRPCSQRRLAQGLALFAAKSARTPVERAFAAIARPALTVVLTLKALLPWGLPIRR